MQEDLLLLLSKSKEVRDYFLPFGLSFPCVSAEPAMLFCVGVDFGFDKTFDAFEATDGLVFSFFAIAAFLRWMNFQKLRPRSPSTQLLLID